MTTMTWVKTWPMMAGCLDMASHSDQHHCVYFLLPNFSFLVPAANAFFIPCRARSKHIEEMLESPLWVWYQGC